MHSTSYLHRRAQLTTYFDKTAAAAWARLTSTDPVSRIRATVRAGREDTRNTLLDWLPEDLRGKRILDAGCGTGALAVEAAKRGGEVVAIDVAESLIDVARKRAKSEEQHHIQFLVGDMTDPKLGEFDHVVAMDSLIHYSPADVVAAVDQLSERTHRSIVFTFAPRTPLLSAMHFVGRMIPHREHRAPAIVPMSPAKIQRDLEAQLHEDWCVERTHRVATGFYISQSLEVVKHPWNV